tara:strand:+ start:32 stop:472 length:441 start_codon:yes stop_codon:yes gene_type:complete
MVDNIALYNPLHYVTTSRSSSIKGLKYPLRKDDEGGYFSVAYDADCVRNNLRQLLLTERGERVMQPDFGIRLRTKLFEPMDGIIMRELKEDIAHAIATYETRINVKNIEVIPDSAYDQLGYQRINIKLSFSLKDVPFKVETYDVIV